MPATVPEASVVEDRDRVAGGGELLGVGVQAQGSNGAEAVGHDDHRDGRLPSHRRPVDAHSALDALGQEGVLGPGVAVVGGLVHGGSSVIS